ncbi:hypothetical protein [Photobacterium leiognathi]|uniref:hypothetical protein n=1 Tax=Photobacterium leiognathi TaxID=553611 RepID=UPI002735A39B|nr:hypothetical protein [Photobacterium leiognathi]
MKNLMLLSILFSAHVNASGVVTFSGSITAPPCEVETKKIKNVSYSNKKNCMPIIKTTERKNTNDLKGKIVTITYI